MDNTHYIGIIIQTLCAFLRATSEKISGRFSLWKTGRIQTVKKASQSLRPQAQTKFKAFLPAACTSAKILLGSQTCERSECAAASCSLFKREPSEAGLVGKRVKNPFLTRSIRPFSLRETCRINAYGKSAGVYRRYFRICTALLAAPLRIWSPQHQSVRALFCVRSSRTRPTQTRSCPLVSSGVG